MDKLYKFETEQFGISDKSIHFLRSRYCYKTIDFSTIDTIVLVRGKDLKNWLFVLILGIALLTFSVYDTYKIYQLFTDPHIYHIELVRILIPVFPFLFGLYSLRISLRNSIIMKVKSCDKKYYLSLLTLVKKNKYQEFEAAIRKIFPYVEIR